MMAAFMFAVTAHKTGSRLPAPGAVDGPFFGAAR